MVNFKFSNFVLMCDLRLYLLSLLLFWVIKLNSQNSVVYYSSIPSSITTVQSAKANTYLDLTPYLSYQWISIGDAYLYLNNDTLELNLPDSNVICRYIFWMLNILIH